MATFHLAAALAGLALVAWTYYRIWLNMAANQQVIQRIVDRVGHIRAERGLDEPPGVKPSEPVLPGSTAARTPGADLGVTGRRTSG
jgi:hypothetical protein